MLYLHPLIVNPYIIVENSRHTALFLQTLMLIGGRVDSTVTKGVMHLIRNQKDNGWSISADEPSQGADCLTVAFILRTLHLARELGVKTHLPGRNAKALDKAIAAGMKWLADNTVGGYWVYGYKFERKLSYTAHVLAAVPQLEDYYPEEYRLALTNLVYHSGQSGGGVLSEGETLDFQATSELVRALCRHADEYSSLAAAAIDTLVKSAHDPRQISHTHAADWAFTLALVWIDMTKRVLEPQQRRNLDSIADSIAKRMKKLDSNVLDTLLPKEYAWTRPLIFSIAQSVTSIGLEDSVLVHIDNIKRRLLSKVKQHRDSELEVLQKQMREIDSFVERMRREHGEGVAKKTRESEQERLAEERSQVETRYEYLMTRILEATTIEQLEQLEREMDGS